MRHHLAPARALILALALALVLAPRPARADEAPAPTGAAQSHYTAGRDSYRQGLFGRALEDFERSLALTPSPNTRLYLARTLRELGRWSESAEQYALTLREAEQRGGRYLATRDAASVELADVKARLERTPATATTTPPPAAVPAIAAGSTPRDEAPPAAPQQVGPTHAPSTLTWAAGGVALAGTASFAVLYALASDRFGYLEDHCARVRTAACDDARTTGQTQETAAYVSLGVAAVAAAITVYSLVVTRGPRNTTSAGRPPEVKEPWLVSF